MEKINFKKDKIPFTQVANDVLNDNNLSFKAKGLYAYLYSKPQNWDFAIDRIALDGLDGRKGVNSGLKELEAQGYLLREKQKSGRTVYLLKSQMPQMDIRPNAPKGNLPKGQLAKRGTISNKEYKVIKSISNKEKGFIEKLNENQKEKWNEWKEYRKEINKKMTDRTISMQINLLEENLPNLESIINTSIQNGWTGLFEQKESYNNQSAGVIRFNK